MKKKNDMKQIPRETDFFVKCAIKKKRNSSLDKKKCPEKKCDCEKHPEKRMKQYN